MSERTVKNIGMIGYKFMGKVHSHAFKDVPFYFTDLQHIPYRKVICGRTEKLVAQAADNFGWESYSTSWEDVVSDPDIDIIDIASPTFTHHDIAVAAAEKGKDIFCEKPPALNYEQVSEMADAVAKAGVKNMIGFNYRRVPAIALARRLIEEGYIGEIRHFRAVYLQDWIMDPNFPISWQLRKDKAGAGPHIDLNSHLIDLSRYLVGEHEEVVGLTASFISERPVEEKEAELTTKLTASGGKEKTKVDVEDAAIFLTRFENGAIGHFEATRFAGGRKNYERFEINGSKGSLKFNFEKMNRLQYYSQEDPEFIQGFRDILVTEDSHPYISVWWPPGHLIGYENTFVNEFGDFFRSYDDGINLKPDFEDAQRCQQVIDTVLLSAKQKSWINVSDVQS